MIIRTDFGEYDVELVKNTYRNNGNLYVGLVCEDGPFATLTINLEETLPDGFAFVDTNNLPCAEEFIRENNLGEFTGYYGHSGWCEYPLYCFDI